MTCGLWTEDIIEPYSETKSRERLFWGDAENGAAKLLVVAKIQTAFGVHNISLAVPIL